MPFYPSAWSNTIGFPAARFVFIHGGTACCAVRVISRVPGAEEQPRGGDVTWGYVDAAARYESAVLKATEAGIELKRVTIQDKPTGG